MNSDYLCQLAKQLEEAAKALREAAEFQSKFKIDEDYQKYRICDQRLTVRARNALMRDGIETIADLIKKTPDELLGLKNFSFTTLDEVREFLLSIGLTLKLDPDPRPAGSR